MSTKSVKSNKAAVRGKKRMVNLFTQRVTMAEICEKIRDIGGEVSDLRSNMEKLEELTGGQVLDMDRFLARLSHVEKIAKDAAEKASEVEDRQMYSASSTKNKDLPLWSEEYIVKGSMPEADWAFRSLKEDSTLKDEEDNTEAIEGALRRLLSDMQQLVRICTRHDY